MNDKNDNGISFEELDALFSPDFESLLDTYSIKKIETTAIHLYKNINHDKNSFYLRRVMNKRCEILNQSFIWSDDKKQIVINLNDSLFRVFKIAYEEARSISEELDKRINNNDEFIKNYTTKIVINPEFSLDENRGVDRGIKEILLHAGLYSQFGRIRESENVIMYDFEYPPDGYLDKSKLRNQEQCFGGIFDGINLSDAFQDLIVIGKWSLNDIINIKGLWAEVNISKQYYEDLHL
jgi:hypothetical protein